MEQPLEHADEGGRTDKNSRKALSSHLKIHPMSDQTQKDDSWSTLTLSDACTENRTPLCR